MLAAAFNRFSNAGRFPAVRVSHKGLCRMDAYLIKGKLSLIFPENGTGTAWLQNLSENAVLVDVRSNEGALRDRVKICQV